ncbi:MAG: hypothetical protein IOD12_10885 [Silvanigrellales bacterium]|nr:hypothetical protein [Silvanigrellales bacterium]
MASRFKTSFGKRFESFLRSRYTEHYKRIVKGRQNARLALFSWPLTGLFLAMLPAGALTVAVAFLYKQNHPRVAEVLTPESAPIVMPLLYGLCAALGVAGLLIGLFAGIAKASQMIFESEKYELQVRQAYFLEKLSRRANRKRRGMASSRPLQASAGVRDTARPHSDLDIRPGE